MIKVGITGGIGSGKTSVCKIFEVLDIPIYYADERAKALMTTDPDVILGVKNLFGEKAYLPDGHLNRKWIGNIVFGNQEKLDALNAIVHPAVHRDTQKWNDAQSSPYTLREAAIMIESGGYKLVDKLIVVYTPKEIRIQRVMKRDKVERAVVEARISKQMPDIDKLDYADYLIYNDGKTSLIQQVLQIHEDLIK